jgi:penicillin-binding protein 2
LLVTPLQVASFIAAIGNGGTLYRPQVIEKIAAPGEEPVLTFHTEAAGKLPLQPETLQAIQQALVGVVQGTNPRGTAQHVFTGLDIPVAGKTGTAQTGISAPHAWFAGYTDAQQSDRPDIAIAVVVENIGEGSDYAAPIFRRIVELYFRGLPGKLYDWEATYNVTSTPPPDALVVPTPAP